ncbi:MAG: DUF975 family protein [Patescibacteria group bacterium]
MSNKNFNLSGTISNSWEIFTKNIGFFIVYFLISAFISLVSTRSSSLVSLIFSILSMIISYGFTYSLVKMVRNKSVTIKDLWYPKVNIISGIAVGFILTPLFILVNIVFIALPALIIGFDNIQTNTVDQSNFYLGNLILLLAIAILAVLINLVISIRFSFVVQFIVDKDLGPLNSIKASWTATKGKFTRLLLFYLQLLGLNILGLLALGIGLLITIPLTNIAVTYAYKELADDAEIEDDFSDDFVESNQNTDDKEVEVKVTPKTKKSDDNK